MVIESADPETGTITIRRWAITLEVWREDFDRQIGFGGWRPEWPELVLNYRSGFVFEREQAAVEACGHAERHARPFYPDDLDGGRQFFFVSRLRYDRVVVDETELGP